MGIIYTDKDSFHIKYNMSREELEKKVKEYLFDRRNYLKDHTLFSNANKKVIGKMKNGVAGTDIKEFCGLRPKSYAYTTFDNTKKAKGVKRQIVKNEITYNDYKDHEKAATLFVAVFSCCGKVL